MKRITLFLMSLALLGCGSKKPASTPEEAIPKSTGPSWALELVWESDTLMSTSESVLFDEAGQQLIVSCINGAPWVADRQGFLALLNLDGSIKASPWVEGLNAPKGSGLYEGLLYVADLNQVVLIDMETAAIKEKITLQGAIKLNDISVGSDGTVYVSDSETGWVWTLKEGRAEPWIKEGFAGPNGLLAEKNRVLLADAGRETLLTIDKESMEAETVTEGLGHSDGIAWTGKEGHYLVSSWNGEIFLILPDFSKLTLLDTRDRNINAADIGFNVADQLVYVPTFYDNRVMAYRLTE